MRHGCAGGGWTAWGRRLLLVTLSLALAAAAATTNGRAGIPADATSLVDPALLNAAAANPLSSLQVIVQADSVQAATAAVTAAGGQIRRQLSIIDGVAANVPAAVLQTVAAAAGARSR